MKTTKKIILLLISTLITMNMNAMHRIPSISGKTSPRISAKLSRLEDERWYEWWRKFSAAKDLEYDRLRAARKAEAERPKSVKSLKELAALGTLKQLLAQPSKRKRSELLNKLPIEMKEYLIEIIKHQVSLLDRYAPIFSNEVSEREQVKVLERLQNEIASQLGK